MTAVKNYEALGLTDAEYQHILGILKREPTPTELAMFSVEWSEHCGYTHSKKLLQALPKKGKYKALIGEDSGGIVVGGLAIVFKMESHNHPSQVEPKQGAATGVGGIIRDIFTAGARPIALLDSLRFGELKHPYNRYLLRGVVDGIQFYGNCVGVPTVGGEIYFDQSYNGNCLVNAMCIGICPKDKLARARATGVGNSIMYVGSTTGRDGIGGCSILASQEFKECQDKRPTVQIGDPFTEKCLIEATLEALETGHIAGIKDMGAAGLTCATVEMAAAGNSGVEIELQAVPRREENMAPWEVMMSESQERMLVCVKKGNEKFVRDIFVKWGLNASVIGKVTDDGIVRVRDKGELVVEVSAQALTRAPLYDVPFKKPEYLSHVRKLDLRSIKQPRDYNRALLKLLGSVSIASKEWVYRQYDHMVQANTMVLPGSDAAVIRLRDVNKAIAATCDCNSLYCYLNPLVGAQIAVAEAARNLACSGATPAAVTDCLDFGNPKKPDRFWQFKKSVEGISRSCRFFNIPVVSGNVSFYNESPKGSIYPTPGIGMIGIIDDPEKICTQYFKNQGEVVILLGPAGRELGGSRYLQEIHKLVKGDAPQLKLPLEKAVQKTALEAIRKGLASSAHDCSEGGLAVCLAESCISGKDNMIGAVIDDAPLGVRLDAGLFGETQSRIIISCPKSSAAKIKAIAQKFKAPFKVIGVTGGAALKISHKGKEIINADLEKLSQEWRGALEKHIQG
ncbi:MAG: phosphoribosylformylglycinamidine synthase subunit PurL [Candidatus Omnitrophota bacterium]|nr:phosphoribosylformylglycinamidine synthase subunit PurL [Candidatus Omnitrophota bacterium]